MLDNMKDIKLIVMDVDGVLTNGNIIIGSNGIEYKSFSVKDGMGISLAKYHGIEFAIITGRKSESVRIRANELGIEHVYQGISNKIEVLCNLMKLLKIKYENICYIGDDINDLAILERVGVSVCPSDAVNLVKKKVDYVTIHKGGHGAVREIIDLVLDKQTDYNGLVRNFLKRNNIRQ